MTSKKKKTGLENMLTSNLFSYYIEEFGAQAQEEEVARISKNESV